MLIKYIYYPPAGTAFTGISSDENYEKTFEFLTFVSKSNGHGLARGFAYCNV